ncbi:hypothetical protein [Shouchella miscanthi]|uniref:Tetratricopeptide repeat protein n=1 Tax=Shouchella miscanthi TaxID=2598861 RepID=A0ABU6NNT1_9BACI|nr:tetratricopeptide repeat protein [Shouchella miscanthi]
MVVYSIEKVGQKIVEWYSCIIAKDLKQAKISKADTDLLINNMEQDDKTLTYYQLVSLRHDLLLLRESPEETTLEMDESLLERIADQTSDYLNFMYYYVWGQTEFYNQRYKSAIRTYKIAERLIEKVKDPAEKAEFYQKLGKSYYQIDQYTFAFSYIEQALEFFEKDESYLINIITCKQLLAGIYDEIGQHDKAEECYKELLPLSVSDDYSHALTNYNLGISAKLKQDFLTAIEYFNKALSIDEFKQSPVSLKAKYHIINLNLRLGKAPHTLEETEKAIHTNKAIDLEARLMISRGLYIDQDYSLVTEGLSVLERFELFHECHNMGEEISKHFKEKNDFETALRYFEYSVEMSKRKSVLGDDQT